MGEYSKPSRRAVLGGLGTAVAAAAVNAQSPLTPFYVTIIREQTLPDVLHLGECIYGRLFVGRSYFDAPNTALPGQELCATLELPFRDNRQDISACLPGTYHGSVRTAPTNSGAKLGWRINLDGTPGRQGVQIHLGNSPQNTVGCIIVGRRTPPPPMQACWVGGSAQARDAVKAAYNEPSMGRHIEIRVA